MSYSPVPFVHGLEGGVASLANAFFGTMRREAERDRSGAAAVSKLITALRRERRRTAAAEERLAAAEAELTSAYEQLAAARLLLRQRA